jgi:predicted nucleic acid-binding protein
MSAICLIDTSVFVELLNVPNKAGKHKEILGLLTQRVDRQESLFLPMATILETGNHIGQNGDGGARRACATRFVTQVEAALNGKSPFTPINFLQADALRVWLKEFPDHAATGSGLGDLSIVHDWKRLCHQHRARRVYIWSLDAHLSAYDRAPEL